MSETTPEPSGKNILHSIARTATDKTQTDHLIKELRALSEAVKSQTTTLSAAIENQPTIMSEVITNQTTKLSEAIKNQTNTLGLMEERLTKFLQDRGYR
jgi:hypothetical protein